MLHQCSHSCGGSAMAPCSCGFLHGACGGSGASFSILFPMSGKQTLGEAGNMSPSSSSVDCTLSLGTPSTRQSEKTSASTKTAQHSTCVPSFCWDILSQSSRHTSAGGRGTTSNSSNMGGDPLLLARRCANCDTTSTPLWRNGPRGPKSLCNACGIRYKKEERRAAASTASPSAADQVIGYSHQRPVQQPWGSYSSATMVSKGNSMSMSFAGGGDESRHDDEDDAEVPYLSWRLNVVPPSQFSLGERTSLFQYQY